MSQAADTREAQLERVRVQGLMEAVSAQRNNALNEAANLRAQVAVMSTQLAEANAQLAKQSEEMIALASQIKHLTDQLAAQNVGQAVAKNESKKAA